MIMEPTLGFPMQPMLARKLASKFNIDRIILISFPINSILAEEEVELYRLSTGCKVEEITTLLNEDIAALIKQNTFDFIKEFSSSEEIITKFTFKGIRIGQHFASQLQRHNSNLCIEFNLKVKDYINQLAEWVAYYFLLGELSKRYIINTSLWTHNVYMKGFLIDK